MARTRSLNERVLPRPKRSLAQHFLISPKTASQILSLARFRRSDTVVEVGPGRGAITLPLARIVDRVVAVEKDAQLVHFLERRISQMGIGNVTLIHGDILKWDLHEAEPLGTRKVQVIGNLPYNISSPFLEKLIESRVGVERAVLMFQLELARRICSEPGGRVYGAISVWVQYHAKTTPLAKVPAEAFYPRPKVDSMVVELDFQQPYRRRARDENLFRRVVKAAFAHRRKTLLNSLRGGQSLWSQESLVKAMGECDIDPRRRAETLSIHEFLCLSSSPALI